MVGIGPAFLRNAAIVPSSGDHVTRSSAAVLAPYCASERRVGMSVDFANGTAGNLIETLGRMRVTRFSSVGVGLKSRGHSTCGGHGEGGTSAASAKRASAVHLCTATMREGNPDVRTSGRPRASPVVRTPRMSGSSSGGKKACSAAGTD